MQIIKPQISNEDFRDLAYITDFDCVSIYIPLNEIDKALVDEILNTVKQKFSSQIIGYTKLNNILGYVEQIFEDNLLQKNNDGKTLVIFINENLSKSFLIDQQLKSYFHITSNFYLLPLFPRAHKSQLINDVLQIEEITSTNQVITNRLEKIIPLAYEREIETLYVSPNDEVHGVYDGLNKSITIDKEKSLNNMSLINLAAIITYQFGGNVKLIDPQRLLTKGIIIQAILKQKL